MSDEKAMAEARAADMLEVPTLTADDIRGMVYVIRGKQVMLDSDLAKLYRVETKRINEAASRNRERFPERYCFQSLIVKSS